MIVSLTSVANWTRAFNLASRASSATCGRCRSRTSSTCSGRSSCSGLSVTPDGAGRSPPRSRLILACAAWRIWLATHGATVERLYNGFDTRCDALLVGCALALSGIAQSLNRIPSAVASAVRVLWLPSALALIAIMVAFQWGDRSMFLGLYTLVAMLAAVLILATLQQTLFARMMEYAPLVATGRISYALYLWHYPIWFVLHLHYGVSMVASGLLTIPLSFAAAAASYFVIERPFLRLRYATQGRSARVTGPAAAGFMAGTFALGVIYFVAPVSVVFERPGEIVDFGPREIALGESFNRQPSGNSRCGSRPGRSRRARGSGSTDGAQHGGDRHGARPKSRCVLAQAGPLPIVLVSPEESSRRPGDVRNQGRAVTSPMSRSHRRQAALQQLAVGIAQRLVAQRDGFRHL